MPHILDDIFTIQLIRERFKDSKNNVGVSFQKTSFSSYELNLELESGKRVTVVDHFAKTKLKDDAGTLSQFLGVQVWDRSL